MNALFPVLALLWLTLPFLLLPLSTSSHKSSPAVLFQHYRCEQYCRGLELTSKSPVCWGFIFECRDEQFCTLHVVMTLPSCIWMLNSLTSIVLKKVAEKVNNCFLFILFLLSSGACLHRVLQLHPVTIAIPKSYRMFFNDEIFLPLLNIIFQQLLYFWDPISSQETKLLHKASKWLCYCAQSDWWTHVYNLKLFLFILT